MCGVFGAVVPSGSGTEAAAIASLGLFALQHRGQESAGVAVSDGEQLMLYKDLGMISSVLDVPLSALRHAWDHGLSRAIGWEEH